MRRWMVFGVVAGLAAASGAMPLPADAARPRLLQAPPVRGESCDYSNTWGAPRRIEAARVHEGVDIIAPLGTPVLAVAEGRITVVVPESAHKRGGNQLSLTSNRGNRYVYTHLDRFAGGMRKGTAVRAGQVIGYVGETGNASVPHLHFEVHPQGGPAVDPMPYITSVDTCGRRVADRNRPPESKPRPKPKPTPKPKPKPKPKPGDPGRDDGGVGSAHVAARLGAMAKGRVAGVQVVGFPGIPRSTKQVTLKVAIRSSGRGRAAIWPCGQRAGLKSGARLKVRNGRVTTTVRIAPGAGGRVCIVADRSVSIVVAITSHR